MTLSTRWSGSGVATVLALWLLVTGRWGSYVGFDHIGIFVTEIALAVAGVVFLVQLVRGLVDTKALLTPKPALALTAVLLIVVIVRLITSAEPSRETFRDFAPYGYAGIALLTFLTPLARWERWTVIVFTAFGVHAAWLAFSLLAPDQVADFPTIGDAPLFASRPDFDGMVCGLAVALVVYWLREQRRGPLQVVCLIAFAAINAALLLILPSRAGLLAFVAAGLVALWTSRRPRRRGPAWRRVARWTLSVLGLSLAIGILLLSTPGQRLVDSVKGEGQAAGTTNARLVVWRATTDYITAETTRTLFGVGFGPDFLHDSGADKYFEGVTYTGVRSPHNYWLGTWARTGLAGLAIVVALTFAAAASAIRMLGDRRRQQVTALDVLATLSLVSIPVVGALGVVQESPFGAVPYFWAIGHVARSAYQQRSTAGSQRSMRTSRPASSSSST